MTASELEPAKKEEYILRQIYEGNKIQRCHKITRRGTEVSL